MSLPTDLTKWMRSVSAIPSEVRTELTSEFATRGIDSQRWDSIVRSSETPEWLAECGVTEEIMTAIRKAWTDGNGAPDDENRNSARLSRPKAGAITDLCISDPPTDPCTVEYDIQLSDWKWKTPVPARPNGQPGGFTQACDVDRDRITAFYRFQGLPSVSDGLVTDELCSRVYAGPMVDAAYLPLLQALGITHILNLAHEARCAEELRPFERHKISYMHIPIHDTLDQVKLCLREKEFSTLRTASEFVHQTLADPRNKLMVHCVQGLSRAPSIVASYMMNYLGYSLDNAIEQIRRVHEGACHPFRFEELLREFEKTCVRSRPNDE